MHNKISLHGLLFPTMQSVGTGGDFEPACKQRAHTTSLVHAESRFFFRDRWFYSNRLLTGPRGDTAVNKVRVTYLPFLLNLTRWLFKTQGNLIGYTVCVETCKQWHIFMNGLITEAHACVHH